MLNRALAKHRALTKIDVWSMSIIATICATVLVCLVAAGGHDDLHAMGTANTVAKFTASSTVANSTLTDNGTLPQSTTGGWGFADGVGLGVSGANTGTLRYNNTTHTFQSSTNGAAFADLGTGTVSGSGTANTVAKFTGSSAVGNGWALDDGTTWGVSGKFSIVEATGATTIGGTLTADAASIGAAGITNAGSVKSTGTGPSLSAGCGLGATTTTGNSTFTITTTAAALGTCVATFATALASATPTCTVTSRNAFPVVYTADATTVTMTTGLVAGKLYDVSCTDH